MSSIILTELEKHNLLSNSQSIQQQLAAVTVEEVRQELSTPIAPFSMRRALRLFSPAAGGMLEEMAQASSAVTVQRFGKTVSLYAPLYVSNYCCNACLYCGFNTSHRIERRRLTIEQAVEEAHIIAEEGFTDLLLVSGEDPTHIPVDYFCELTRKLRGLFSTISIEIYPVDLDGYKQMFEAGVDGMTLYQETYDRELYPKFHPAGPKSDYARRLLAVEDAASAGMRQIGISPLLGISEWRYEALCTALHGHVIAKNFWKSRLSISFPRMRPAAGVNPEWLRPVGDRELVQMLCAFRLCFSDAGLVISTRESAEFRDHILLLGITRMSAGSRTNPGGYGEEDEGESQFSVADTRSPAAIADMLVRKGYDPVWKDWDSSFLEKAETCCVKSET